MRQHGDVIVQSGVPDEQRRHGEGLQPRLERDAQDPQQRQQEHRHQQPERRVAGHTPRQPPPGGQAADGHYGTLRRMKNTKARQKIIAIASMTQDDAAARLMSELWNEVT